MSTKVYGASDDLIELEGELTCEHGQYGTSEEEPVLVFLSDASVLLIYYGDGGIWKITVKEKGALFDHLDICTDPDDKPYSDIAHFRSGIKWAYALKAKEPPKRVN